MTSTRRLSIWLIAALTIVLAGVMFSACGGGSDPADTSREQARDTRQEQIKAEKRVYGALIARIDATDSTLDDTEGEVGAPEGDVPSTVSAYVPFGTPGVNENAGEYAEDHAKRGAKQVWRRADRLPATWKGLGDELADLRSPALVTKFRRAYRATLDYTRDGGRFMDAAVTFLQQWNQLSYVQELYLAGEEWDAYKTTADTARASKKDAKKALRSAHVSFRRAIKGV
jgi:hypothetical protein